MLSSAFVAVMHPEGLHFNLNVQPPVLETAPKCVVVTLEWISTKTKVIFKIRIDNTYIYIYQE